MSEGRGIEYTVIRLGTGRDAVRRMIGGVEHKFCPDCDGWVPLAGFYGGGRASGYCKPHTSKRNGLTSSKRAKRVADPVANGADE